MFRFVSTARSQRGSALIAVLWISALLTVLVGSAAYLSRVEVRYAAGHAARAKLVAAIDGGIQLAINDVMAGLRNARADPPPREKRYIVGGIAVQVKIESESGKIDINYAPTELLSTFARFHGASEDEAKGIAAAIADWRDSDNLERSGGAEAAAYQAAGLDYGPRNDLFSQPFELQRVPGISKPLAQKMLPFVTTHAASRGVDLSAASKDMLMFFTGNNEGEVDRSLTSTPQTALTRRNSLTAFVKPELRRYVSRGRRQVFTLRVTAKTVQYSVERKVVFEVTNKRDQPFRFL